MTCSVVIHIFSFSCTFPLVLMHSRKWVRQGRSTLGNPHFLNSTIWDYQNYKDRFDVSKPTMETLIFTHNTVLIYFKSAESRFL